MEHIADAMPEARLRRVPKKPEPVRPVTAPRAAPSAIIEQVEKPAKPKRKGNPAQGIVAWWPVAVSIFLTGFVAEWHESAVAISPWIDKFLFPYAYVVARPELGISLHMATVLPQYALYLQLPLEGLYGKLLFDRGKGLQVVITQLILIHATCVFVLWLLNYLH